MLEYKQLNIMSDFLHIDTYNADDALYNILALKYITATRGGWLVISGLYTLLAQSSVDMYTVLVGIILYGYRLLRVY